MILETIRELISVSFLSVSTVWFVILYNFSIESPLTLGRTFSHTPTVVQGGGGGVDRTPLGFLYVALFRNNFVFGGKPLISSTRCGIFYGWWRC